MRKAAPAVFIDKDGTLVENEPFSVSTNKVRFVDKAFEALSLLHGLQFKLIVVTNQPGIALGYFTESDLMRLALFMEEEIRRSGTEVNGFFYCPHPPFDEQGPAHCFCRKPKPGLLYEAARSKGIDLARSWLIGDILDDVEAGRAANCRTVLIDNGNETEWRSGWNRLPHYKARSILEAAQIIEADRCAVGRH